MIVSYLRSSSYNTFNNCQQQYFLSYVLGLDNPAGKAATKGNTVHKALECLALRKKNEQALAGKSTSYILDDSLGEIPITDCEPDILIRKAFDWHVEHFEHTWDLKRDFNDCKKWMWEALNYYDGLFDPRNRNVIDAEKQFDFEIKKPWAKYNYKLPNGQVLDGYLSLKGTIDLITEVSPGVLEIIDWKTGRYRSDFATGKEKDYAALYDDLQLRLYHYAAHKVYPSAKDIIITIFYIQAGGPFTIPLGMDDFDATEKMIEKQFEYIRRTVKPTLNPGPQWSQRPNSSTNWKCYKLCTFSQPSIHDPNKTTCQFFRDKIKEIGMEKVVTQYGDLSKISTYQDGGGRHIEINKKVEK